MSTRAGEHDGEASLPATAINQIIKDTLGERRAAREVPSAFCSLHNEMKASGVQVRKYLERCMIEYIRHITGTAQQICAQRGAKTINHEDIVDGELKGVLFSLHS